MQEKNENCSNSRVRAYRVFWDQDKDRITREQVGRTPWTIDACPMA